MNSLFLLRTAFTMASLCASDIVSLLAFLFCLELALFQRFLDLLLLSLLLFFFFLKYIVTVFLSTSSYIGYSR